MNPILRLLLLAALLAASPLARAQTHQHPEAELDGNCALSASLGNKLPTDCSVVWISPKSDKLYCFSSEKAKQTFLRQPSKNEELAQAFWQDPAFWERMVQERDTQDGDK
jgi:hypothetical protein